MLRVKKIVLPSGENAGEPSFAGPETTPGAKISGAGADEIAALSLDKATQAVELSEAARVAAAPVPSAQLCCRFHALLTWIFCLHARRQFQLQGIRLERRIDLRAAINGHAIVT